MSEPTKHHFVPQFLLRRFADEEGQLVAHRLRNEGSFRTNARDIGHRNDGHTLYLRSGAIDRSSLETAMSAIEGEASRAVDQLESGASLMSEHKRALAWFISLQWTRHRYLLNQIAGRVEGSGLTREEVQTGLLRVVLGPLLSAWTLRENEDAHHKERWNYIVGAALSFQWKLLRFSEDVLVLGDTTVCMSGVRAGDRPEFNAAWARHGIGVGWENVARVSVPVSPRLGLLLTRTGKPDRLRPSAFNRTTIFNSREFVLHAPNWTPSAEMRLRFEADITRQRLLAAAFGDERL